MGVMSDLPSPKAFLKSRRPHKFSDSVIVKNAVLNRSMLDQHLESLTTRNQENEFAEFARKLCELEICPNLRPQTGPVGGGDSKVDTETIPVSLQTQLAYYQGQDNQSKEPFAFAFSAKKKWTEKARSDVRKIAALKKGYARIYFVTNQAARDKTRATIEKELAEECGVQVVILDKNWILDRVFTNKREKLAIEKLEMGNGLEEVVDVGPLDLQRRKRLQQLNSSIEEAVSKETVTHGTVGDAIDVALIAAALENPRTEVEGQFERAIRMARQYGNKEHLFTALYQRAWTTFFWFEDFKTFIGLYDEIEALAIESCNIFSIERLSNLWSLLRALSAKPELVSQELLDKKAAILRKVLGEVISNDANPSASVHAEAMLCMLELTQAHDDGTGAAAQFAQLRDILDRANELIGFPFEPIISLLTELDTIFSGVKEYEELQEHLVDVVAKRRGEIPAAELLLKRGIQHLKAKRYYQAIDCLGRSLHRFFKHESKDDLVRALILLARAYREVGLLWAARGALLNAASHATSNFWVYNEINTAQLRCYDELGLNEVQLGRVGAALDWHSVHVPMAMQLASTDEERGDVLQHSLQFGMILGLLLIKTREENLKAVEKLPDTLNQMDLDFAAMGLVYRLGGKDAIPEDVLKNLGEDDPDTFFGYWLTQPAQEELADYPDYYLSEEVELRSRTLGCEFVVHTKKTSPEIDIAEYIIAALESFLSTAIELDAAPRDSIAIVNISRDDALVTDLAYEINMDGKLTIDVTCGNFNPHSLSKDEQKRLTEKVSDIVLHLIARAIMFADPDVDLKKLFKDEEVNSRAFSFSSPLIRLGNVIGYDHKRAISEWIDEKNKTYPYVPGKFPLTIPPKKVREIPPLGEEGTEPLTHADLTSNSIIRMHLWDSAGWQGAFYLTAEHRSPVVGILFKDEKAARAIFEDWRAAFGKEDKEDTIHVAVARGVNAAHPAWYTMGVGTKLDPAKPPGGRLMTITRLHTLNPETTENLDRFMASFKEWGIYLFAPAIMREGKPYPDVLFDVGIAKHEFTDRNAWEIGPNDFDVALVTPDADPVIPPEVSDAPVLETLKKKKEMQERHSNKKHG